MTCVPLKSEYLGQVTTVGGVLAKLDSQLEALSDIALDTDFTDASQTAIFKANVEYIKTYIERVERLIRERENHRLPSARVDTKHTR